MADPGRRLDIAPVKVARLQGPTVTKFLQSGRRRDVCAILAGEPRQAQAVKSRLSAHYDERIDPASFYGALDALEDAGFVESRTEGIHDVYALTDAGEARLREHYDWLGVQLAESGGDSKDPDGDGES